MHAYTIYIFYTLFSILTTSNLFYICYMSACLGQYVIVTGPTERPPFHHFRASVHLDRRTWLCKYSYMQYIYLIYILYTNKYISMMYFMNGVCERYSNVIPPRCAYLSSHNYDLSFALFRSPVFRRFRPVIEWSRPTSTAEVYILVYSVHIDVWVCVMHTLP